MREHRSIPAAAISEEPTPWGAVIAVEGELDLTGAPALRERVDAALGRGVTRLLFDLSAVTFIDSVSLAAIVAAGRRMGEGGRLAVATDHEYVLLILEAGGLDGVVDVFPSREEAEAALVR